ncbi:hypothetical protein [Microbacterium sp. SSM24]|uniref:hypothetical protein n=1 Tax=Microbacterium sp. SSM24 TaxID=2991714 RepID=UPI0022273BBF|nr:hypothetical protein [Microbacterium sp. SSM24]MCW3494591.1 hypothetical protein [Microbacterium sp. SSM24]
MTSPTKLIAVAGFGLAVALAGCAPTPTDIDPTPTFSSEAEAFAAAEATYREYIKALNAVDLSDPETFEDVYAWTTGDLNASDRESLTRYHADGAEIGGESTIDSVSPAPKANIGRVQLAVCLNVSEFELIDAAGKSLIDEDRADILSLTVNLARSQSSPTGLLVDAIGPRTEDPQCGR